LGRARTVPVLLQGRRATSETQRPSLAVSGPDRVISWRRQLAHPISIRELNDVQLTCRRARHIWRRLLQCGSTRFPGVGPRPLMTRPRSLAGRRDAGAKAVAGPVDGSAWNVASRQQFARFPLARRAGCGTRGLRAGGRCRLQRRLVLYQRWSRARGRRARQTLRLCWRARAVLGGSARCGRRRHGGGGGHRSGAKQPLQCGELGQHAGDNSARHHLARRSSCAVDKP
jgi:hypothetical protein